MDTEPIQDNLTAARYGAFVLITQLLYGHIDRLSTQIEHGDTSNTGLFTQLADDMIAAIEALAPTPDSDDAYRQLLGLLQQHRAFIADPAPFTLPARTVALAEIQEMSVILVVATDRLGRRLGILAE